MRLRIACPRLAVLPRFVLPALLGGMLAWPCPSFSDDEASAAAQVPTVASPDSDRQLSDLQLLWAARRSEILTADIRYRQMLGSSPKVGHSPDEVAAILSRYDLATEPDRMGELIAELRGAPLSRVPPWAPSRLALEGTSVRYEQDAFCLIQHGELELIYDGDNTQTGVYPRGKSQRMLASLDDFRRIPNADLPIDVYRVIAHDNQTVRVVTSTGSARVLYDRPTGLMLYRQNVRPETGEVWREQWTQGITQYADGIPFPAAVIEADYTVGRLSGYWIRVVEQADFNQPLPPETFHSALSAGGTVIDYRGETKTGYRQPDATSDLAASLRSPLAVAVTRASGPPEDRSNLVRWLLAFNGLLLVLGGIYMWRRDRRKMRDEVAKAESNSDSNSL